jgi:putative peptidoglycan lipid II flippase
VLQINPLVDRAMVSGLGSGSVTALELGLRLFVVPTGLLTGMLIGPIAATWAAREASGGWPLLRDSLSGMITAVLAVIPPVVVLGVVLRHQLVALMYQGGAYSPHALQQTTSVFGMLLLGLPAQMLGIAFATLFIVKKDAVFPMKIGLANAGLNVVLNFALRPVFGVAGIALSTSLTFTTLVAVYAVAAHRRWGTFSVQETWAPLMRMATSTLIIAAAAVGLVSALPAATSRPRALLVVAVVGAVGLTLHGVVLLVGRDRSVVVVASRFLHLPSRASA